MAYSPEKRDFERMKVNTAVTLTLGSPSRDIEGICYDVSESGIGLVLDSVVPMGSECQVRIHDGHRNHKKFQALIEVKRVEVLGDGRCVAGAIILEKF